MDTARRLMAELPLSDADKETFFNEFKPMLDDGINDYAENLINEVNSGIEEAVAEINTGETGEYFNAVKDLNNNIHIYIIISVGIFVIMWLLALLIFKARRPAFFVPAVAVIFSGIASFLENAVSTFIVKSGLADFLPLKDDLENFIGEAFVSLIGNLKGKFLIFGAVCIVFAVVLFVVGSVIHMVRGQKNGEGVSA